MDTIDGRKMITEMTMDLVDKVAEDLDRFNFKFWSLRTDVCTTRKGQPRGTCPDLPGRLRSRWPNVRGRDGQEKEGSIPEELEEKYGV